MGETRSILDGITYDVKKVKRVPIAEVRANSWNPKLDDTEEEKKILLSVKENGQRIPIVVRQNDGYEIIDGEQRFKACKALGFTEVLVYDEGEMNDNAAKALTIWYQQQVPFDKILEAELVNSINNALLPYTPEELDNMRQIVEFDWEKVVPDDNEDVQFRTLTLRMLKEAYEVVMSAINKVQLESNVTIERAIELICADFLAE